MCSLPGVCVLPIRILSVLLLPPSCRDVIAERIYLNGTDGIHIIPLMVQLIDVHMPTVKLSCETGVFGAVCLNQPHENK